MVSHIDFSKEYKVFKKFILLFPLFVYIIVYKMSDIIVQKTKPKRASSKKPKTAQITDSSVISTINVSPAEVGINVSESQGFTESVGSSKSAIIRRDEVSYENMPMLETFHDSSVIYPDSCINPTAGIQTYPSQLELPEFPCEVVTSPPEYIVPDTTTKKRGRKPRGGKLILRPSEMLEPVRSITNVILHLRCSTKDLNDYNVQIDRIMTDPLKYNPEVPPDIVTYNDTPAGFTTFQTINNSDTNKHRVDIDTNSLFSLPCNQCSTCKTTTIHDDISDLSENFDTTSRNDTINIKDINSKLKLLKVQLYKNAIQLDKKSACFWCTYDFDNIPCHIPKYEMEDTIYGYGSFCRPECAVAYLMKENIDDSTKFERYQLLNQIYSKIYECKKNIKPAPNPYYLLDKYYGNLTIQEYRKLLKTEHLLLVIDKPLTRILPELHEDNEDMIMNIYGINKSAESISGVYKVKRQSEKQQGPSKASIIRSKFGLC